MTDSTPILLEYYMTEDVRAFSTTRHNGFSKGNYSSLNIDPYCGDEAQLVKKNKELLCKYLRIKEDCLLFAHQVHKDEILEINSDFFSLSEKEKNSLLEAKDGLITNIKGISIGVSTADCAPILLYDPKNHASAAIHAGWRGTVKRIVQKTISLMEKRYSSKPKDIIATIGPCISIDAFEVGQEVYEEFLNAKFDMEKISVFKDKWHIDLALCNKVQLLEMGVENININFPYICSYINIEDFFSARRLGINSGRTYNGIIIKEF